MIPPHAGRGLLYQTSSPPYGALTRGVPKKLECFRRALNTVESTSVRRSASFSVSAELSHPNRVDIPATAQCAETSTCAAIDAKERSAGRTFHPFGRISGRCERIEGKNSNARMRRRSPRALLAGHHGKHVTRTVYITFLLRIADQRRYCILTRGADAC